MEELPRPEVTLVRSSLPPVLAEERAPAQPSRRWPLLGLVALALLAAGTPSPAEPPPPPVLSAMLVPQPGGLTLSQSGVLVLPFELRNPGPALEVTEAQAYAEPVRDDAVVQAPPGVRASGLRRFVALVTPDCRLLRPGSPIEFRATVRLRVQVDRSSEDLVVDVAAVPGVRETVTGLCG